MPMWGKRRKIYSFKWDESIDFDPAQAFAPFSSLPYSLFFDNARKDTHLGRDSYICINPFETLESKNGTLTLTQGNETKTFQGNPFTILQRRLDNLKNEIDGFDTLPYFCGGAAGYFGYDLARDIEKLPSISKDNEDMPDMIIGLYGQVIRHDHETGETVFYICANTKFEAKRRYSAIKEKILNSGAPESYSPPKEFINWTPSRGDAEYRQDIRKAIEYIYAGDIYQACLSRRFTARLPDDFDHYAHYLNLRKVNPAPFACYMNFGEIKLASASPERFLKLQNGQVETRPIKGTISSDRPASELQGSAKNMAENAMIVDLLRNDLSKVCTDFSVEVPSLCQVETYEGLHHLVSVITAELRADKTPCDLIKACFPGGSISGAPKVRAMEIIEELEPERRGPWCGSMGMIGLNNIMDLNIMIRTIIYDGHNAQIQTGGGITAKSDPNDELNETLLKAKKLFESFESNVKDKGKKSAA